MIPQVFLWNLKCVIGLCILAPILCGMAVCWLPERFRHMLAAGLLGLAMAAVYYYCIHGREPSNARVFVIVSGYYDEFYRELLMNSFLFVPLGISMPFLLPDFMSKKQAKAVWLAFLIALCIEYWQYVQGTGVAQVSDLVMNTLGAFIGSFAFPVCNFFIRINDQMRACYDV